MCNDPKQADFVYIPQFASKTTTTTTSDDYDIWFNSMRNSETFSLSLSLSGEFILSQCAIFILTVVKVAAFRSFVLFSREKKTNEKKG